MAWMDGMRLLLDLEAPGQGHVGEPSGEDAGGDGMGVVEVHGLDGWEMD